MKLIMARGLPGSGKTTWAKELLANEPGKWKRINKDDLRAMLDNSAWSKKNEKFVVQTRDFLVTTALISGYSVIVDDTNLHPRHEQTLRQITHLHNQIQKDHEFHEKESKLVEFEVKDFTNIPLEVCIDRDSRRQVSVGAKVIRGMHNQFLKVPPDK
jgi:predicted kinase